MSKMYHNLKKVNSPHPVDIHVGKRLNLIRKEQKFSQKSLADKLGLTFQQIQKYEQGSNRIGASRLYEISKVFLVPVSYFFVGLHHNKNDSEVDLLSSEFNDEIIMFIKSNQGLELNQCFGKIKNKNIRTKIINLVRSLVE